ncbi:MAG: hypothetical protein AB8B72_05020 [Crocinitomicaceae bacterium]
MEIFNGLQYYDIGHLVYDLWLIIVTLFWCTLFTFLIKKSESRKYKLVWDSKAYLQLTLLIIAVLVLISMSSFPSKIGLSALLVVGFYFFTRKISTGIIALLCVLLGFGYTIFPVLAAMAYASFNLLSRKQNIAQG